MNYEFNKVAGSTNSTDGLSLQADCVYFPPAPEIIEAIKKRVASGVWTENAVPSAWYDAVLGWWSNRYGWDMEKDWILVADRLQLVLSGIVRKLTAPGERVLVLTPGCKLYFDAIENNGRQVLECPLCYRGGTYRLDFTDLERRLSDPQTTLMVLSNPHAPTGLAWDRDSLLRIGELCWKHHVLVFSDESGCDLVDPATAYTPLASVSDTCAQNSITYLTPADTFHLSGLHAGAVVILDPALQNRVRQGLNVDGIAPDPFAIAAAIAAYTKGGQWLDELRNYLYGNRQSVQQFLEQELPRISVVPSQSLHSLWLDCSGVAWNAQDMTQYIQGETGLRLSSGERCRGKGKHFLEMNIACPQQMLREALHLLKIGVVAYEEHIAQMC